LLSKKFSYNRGGSHRPRMSNPLEIVLSNVPKTKSELSWFRRRESYRKSYYNECSQIHSGTEVKNELTIRNSISDTTLDLKINMNAQNQVPHLWKEASKGFLNGTKPTVNNLNEEEIVIPDLHPLNKSDEKGVKIKENIQKHDEPCQPINMNIYKSLEAKKERFKVNENLGSGDIAITVESSNFERALESKASDIGISSDFKFDAVPFQSLKIASKLSQIDSDSSINGFQPTNEFAKNSHMPSDKSSSVSRSFGFETQQRSHPIAAMVESEGKNAQQTESHINTSNNGMHGQSQQSSSLESKKNWNNNTDLTEYQSKSSQIACNSRPRRILKVKSTQKQQILPSTGSTIEVNNPFAKVSLVTTSQTPYIKTDVGFSVLRNPMSKLYQSDQLENHQQGQKC
jgi:hypothetical protein